MDVADARNTGQRREGTYFAVMNLVEKFAAGGAVGLTGIALGVIGIQANATQSPEVTQALRVLVSLLPAGMIALSAAILQGAISKPGAVPKATPQSATARAY